jgi:hypothetical protein
MRNRILAHVVRRARPSTATKVLLKVPYQIAPNLICASQLAQYRSSLGKWGALFVSLCISDSRILYKKFVDTSDQKSYNPALCEFQQPFFQQPFFQQPVKSS